MDVDIFANTIHRHVPSTGENFKVTLDGVDSLSVVVPVEGHKDKYLITTGREVKYMEWEEVSKSPSKLKHLHTVEQHLPKNRFNDGKCDPQGRLWVGTMGYEPVPGDLDEKKGTLYKFDLDGSLSKHVDMIDIANGIAWTADNKTMYYIDTFTYRVDAFDFDAVHGKISNRRPAFDFKLNGITGVPDGMTIDSNGNLWVAVFAGKRVLHVDPREGKLIDYIEFPTVNITSVAFGGPNLDILYATSAQHGLSPEEKAAQPDAGCLFKITNTGAKGLSAGSNYKGKLTM